MRSRLDREHCLRYVGGSSQASELASWCVQGRRPSFLGRWLKRRGSHPRPEGGYRPRATPLLPRARNSPDSERWKYAPGSRVWRHAAGRPLTYRGQYKYDTIMIKGQAFGIRIARRVLRLNLAVRASWGILGGTRGIVALACSAGRSRQPLQKKNEPAPAVNRCREVRAAELQKRSEARLHPAPDHPTPRQGERTRAENRVGGETQNC